jgi:hypothetical protein
MSRRTVTIDPKLDQIINIVRGGFLLVGQEYNYTEVINHAIFYGICYWLGIKPEIAVKLAPQFLTTNFKIEGVIDEQAGKLKEEFFKTPT